MTEEKRQPRYSGPRRSGICVCGHSWEQHHCGMVMNEDYLKQTGEIYVPQECEAHGFNETGGLDAEGRDHCHQYRDSKELEEQASEPSKHDSTE